MPLSAVLFDLDGTLVDTERESAEAMARALAGGLGIAITQEERDFIIGRSWVEIYRNLAERHADLVWSRDELIRRTAAERTAVFAEAGMTILPGALEALQRFAGHRRGLVTGSSREEAGQVLDALSLRDVFDVVVASEDVPRSKPAPDGYLQAITSLGAAPGDCVVIEDSAAGVAAGIAAGARVVAVRAGNFHGQDQSAAHAVIDTLEALTPAFVEDLLR